MDTQDSRQQLQKSGACFPLQSCGALLAPVHAVSLPLHQKWLEDQANRAPKPQEAKEAVQHEDAQDSGGHHQRASG
jgi:hypothetical protein